MQHVNRRKKREAIEDSPNEEIKPSLNPSINSNPLFLRSTFIKLNSELETPPYSSHGKYRYRW